MARKSNTAVTAPAPLGKRASLFWSRSMKWRLWAQEQFAEKAIQNLMDIAMDGKVTAACAMVNHTIGMPLAAPPVAANKSEDFVAAIEQRGRQLLEKLDPAETGGPSEISAQSD